MSTPLESKPIKEQPAPAHKNPGWLRIGMVALASGIAGAAAFAWWYRKTIEGLQKADAPEINPEFGISDNDPADEI